MIDLEDIMQAIEIALGDTVGSDIGQRRTVDEKLIIRHTQMFKRILAELPADLSVGELREAMEE